MATYNTFANFAAYFSSPEKAEFASSLIPENGLAITPVDAAAMFGLPWPQPTGDRPDDGFLFVYPFLPDAIIYHPNDSGKTMDPTELSIFVPGQPSQGGMRPNPGADMTITWYLIGATVILPENNGDVTLFAPIPQRRWTYGFETLNRYEARGAIAATNSRDSSRVVDGFGHKIRNDGGTNATVTLATSTATGLPSHNSWERFYMRFRVLGNNTAVLWRTGGSVATLGGGVLKINSSGVLTLFNRGTFGGETLLATGPTVELERWYKVDILVKYATAVLDGSLRLYLDGTLVASGTVGTGGDGLGQNQNHADTTFMEFTAPHTWEVDFDDWHNAEIPNIGGIETLNSVDWMMGTHSKLTKVIPDASNVTTNWFTTGALGSAALFPALNQYENPLGSGVNVQASVALATITLHTNASDFDTIDKQDVTGMNIGAACATVFTEAQQATGGANNCRLGFSEGGFGPALQIHSVGAAPASFLTTFLPNTGSLDPYPIEPFDVIFEKKNTADVATLTVLAAIVQYVGIWGLEDVPVTSPETPEFLIPLLHNCLYPNTAWANIGAPPDAPVCVSSGTYTGNGTFQTISNVSHPTNFSLLPIHLLVIRNLTTNTPIIMNTTMFGPESSAASGVLGGDIPYIGFDNDLLMSFFTVCGFDPRINQNGTTYQFFAFHDPALRYVVNGEYSHGGSANTFANPIIDSLFLPEFAMLFQTPVSPGGFWMKGPANTLLGVNNVNGTLVNNVLQFSAGNLVTAGGINTTSSPMAYSVFRTFDGSELVMVQVTSYTGNGVSPRVIPLVPTSDRFPLAAFVIQATGVGVGAFYRDCGHAGLNSSNLSSGGLSTLGIVGGGIDSISVGSSLNVNGVIYNILVFPGTASGWTCGVYCGPNGVAPGDFWEDPPEELPPGPSVMGEGGLIIGGTGTQTLLKNLSGIYTLVPGKHSDTFYDRQTAQPSVEMEIPDPRWKTGYIGG